MAILFGGSRVTNRTPPATGLRIQTALNGQPIPIVHGQQRIAGNLLWYGDFTAKGGGNGGGGGGKSGGGGKGGIAGGGKGQSASQTSYAADVIIGLCEGPILQVDTIWAGQTIETPAKLGIGVFAGEPGQAPWSFMSTTFPLQALGYTALGYVGAAPLQLGTSPELPSLNFEVTSTIAAAVQETCTVTGPSFTFTPAYFNLFSSVVEQVTIPVTSPYQVQAQNPNATTQPLVVKSGGDIDGSRIPGSASQGVIDSNGRVFARVAGAPAGGQYRIDANDQGWIYTFAADDAGLAITIIDLAVSPNPVIVGGDFMRQVLVTPGQGEFCISVQAGSFGQYQFSATDSSKQVTIVEVVDADPATSLTDFLTNARYGVGFPTANIGDLSALREYAYANGLFISPALVATQAANAYLRDFATGLNGEFVWSSGFLNFVPYGDETVSGFGKTYVPPAAPIYTLNDDDFLHAGGTAGIGISSFATDDPLVCVRTRPSDAFNSVKVKYLDRGNSYNPTVVEAQDDAAINAYGLRPADTRQLHFFCAETPAMMSAHLQLGRQRVLNRFSFTLPWYFILLEPMDIIAVTDARLGLDKQWVRVLEITENQQDGSLGVIGEEYLQGTGSAPAYAAQPRLGYVPNIDATASPVN